MIWSDLILPKAPKRKENIIRNEIAERVTEEKDIKMEPCCIFSFLHLSSLLFSFAPTHFMSISLRPLTYLWLSLSLTLIFSFSLYPSLPLLSFRQSATLHGCRCQEPVQPARYRRILQRNWSKRHESNGSEWNEDVLLWSNKGKSIIASLHFASSYHEWVSGGGRRGREEDYTAPFLYSHKICFTLFYFILLSYYLSLSVAL